MPVILETIAGNKETEAAVKYCSPTADLERDQKPFSNVTLADTYSKLMSVPCKTLNLRSYIVTKKNVVTKRTKKKGAL